MIGPLRGRCEKIIQLESPGLRRILLVDCMIASGRGNQTVSYRVRANKSAGGAEVPIATMY
jgi:hypothetical protein